MDAHLVETAQRVTTTRNAFGDLVFGATTSVACLYRDITTLSRGNANREEVDVDGLLWFSTTEEAYAIRGAVYYHPDEGYLRIERVIVAKRLLRGGGKVFIKCEVTKQRQIS